MSPEPGTMVPDGIDPATGEILPPAGFRLPWEPMNRDQAEAIKTQINAYAIRLPMLVKEAKEAEAWKALGCANWTEFVEEHLVISTEYARLLLRGADKLEELAAATGTPVDLFAIPERVMRQIDTPTMVGVGREVVAELPADTTPQEQADAIDEAVRAKLQEDRMEAAAQRGREKAARDLAESTARKEQAERDAELERLRKAEERRARKEAEAAKNAGDPPPAAPDPTPPGSGATPHGGATEPPTDAPEADGATGLASHSSEDEGQPEPPLAAPVLTDEEAADLIETAAWLAGLVPSAIADAAADPAAATDAPGAIEALTVIDQWVTAYVAHRAIKEQA